MLCESLSIDQSKEQWPMKPTLFSIFTYAQLHFDVVHQVIWWRNLEDWEEKS